MYLLKTTLLRYNWHTKYCIYFFAQMVSLNIWKHLWKHCHSQIMTYSSPSEISLGPLSFFAIQKAVHNECINLINLEEFSPSLLKVNTSGWELQVGVLFFFEGFAPLSFCLHGFWWEVCCNSYPCSSVEKVFFSLWL